MGLAVRLPRMELGLYNDESFAFRRYIHGRFKSDPETGGLKFTKFTWQQTLWENKYGNNGAFYSILARLGHDVWQKSTGAADGEVGEAALRLPSLLAGSASIVVIGLLGYICFGAKASILAALLAALHPWHLRYSTEARPYGVVIFLAAIIILAIILAIREGRWRWWIVFGLAQFLCLWAYIGSLYFLIPINLITLAWMLKSGKDRIPRWFVLNVLGAVFFIQLIAPSLPQIYQSLSGMEVFKGYTGFDDSIEIVAYLISGMPLANNSPDNPLSPAWENAGMTGTVIFWSFVVIFLIGCFRIFVSRDGNAVFVVTAGIGAVLFTIGMSNLAGSVNHHWYLIYALPSFIIMMAGTIDYLWRSRFSFAGPALLLAVLCSFVFPFWAYLQQSKEQLAEIVSHVHGDVYPFSGAGERPLFAAFRSDTVYAPDLIYTPSLEDLKMAIARAKLEKRPLFVEFGYRALVVNSEGTSKGLVDFIENSGNFVLVKTFYGLEETQFTHYLFRLKTDGE